LLGAHISVSAGNKNLKFTSLNQHRLRKLINHIQNRMAEVKKETIAQGETQKQHLENINQQLQAYLLAQYQHQEELSSQLAAAKANGATLTAQSVPSAPIPPSPELSDYLLAQNLLKSYGGPTAHTSTDTEVAEPAYGSPFQTAGVTPQPPQPVPTPAKVSDKDLAEIYQSGRDEVFKKYQSLATAAKATHQSVTNHLPTGLSAIGIEINPLRIAYAKLPMMRMLKNRKFS
jgi:hypothetical protein